MPLVAVGRRFGLWFCHPSMQLYPPTPPCNLPPFVGPVPPQGGGGVGTRPWWLALLACGGAYWPLAFEPSAMTSRHPHCRGHPPSWVGIQNATSAHSVLPGGGGGGDCKAGGGGYVAATPWGLCKRLKCAIRNPRVCAQRVLGGP